jgi:DNA-binding NtrC family response regulator
MMRILIIDNDTTRKQDTEALVSALGHIPVFAENASEGLAVLEKMKCDLVLSELRMLNIPEWSLVKVVKEYLKEKSPVIILSSVHDQYTIERFAMLGAVEFIHKPLTKAGLSSICERYR